MIHGATYGNGTALTWTASATGAVRRIMARSEDKNAQLTMTKNGTVVVQSTGRRCVFIGKIPVAAGDVIVATFSNASPYAHGLVILRAT